MAVAIPFTGWQTGDVNGAPASGGKIYFYVVETTTPLATYSDTALTVPNANPVVMDASGWPGPVYLSSDLSYDFIVKSADDAATYVPRTTIPAGAGGQPVDATLTGIAGLSVSDGDFIKATGVDTFETDTGGGLIGAGNEQTATISTGAISLTASSVVIASQVSGASDNLATVTLSSAFKYGGMIAARINSADEPITILETGNVHTWNGYPATMADPDKTYWFRVDADGLGITLQPNGLDEIELCNEPFGTDDVGVIFVFGQSNAGPTGVAGTPTGAALSYVQHMATGTLSWSAFDTSGSAPFTTNCHISHDGVDTSGAPYANVFHSLAAYWEARQATDSLPVLYTANIAQGGQTLSAKRTSSSTSRWNPDHLKSQVGGTPDASTDGYYGARYTGNTAATPTWSMYELAQQVIRVGLDRIESLGKRPRIMGVVWVHGESDSLASTTAGEYAENLARLHGALSAAAGVQSIPMILSIIRSESYTFSGTTNAAMSSFCRTTPYAQFIDPTKLPDYNGASSPNLGIYADGVHFTESAADDLASIVYDKTVRRNFYGITSSKEARRKTEHRKCFARIKANGSGSNDAATTYDEFLDNGQASGVSRLERFAGVRFSSTSQTIAQVFDPTTGRFILPYSGTYRVFAKIRTTMDGATASNATTGTELQCYTNTTIGAAATAGTKEDFAVCELVTSGITFNASGKFRNLLLETTISGVAGTEVILVNNNYRQSSSLYEWQGTIELIELIDV